MQDLKKWYKENNPNMDAEPTPPTWAQQEWKLGDVAGVTVDVEGKRKVALFISSGNEQRDTQTIKERYGVVTFFFTSPFAVVQSAEGGFVEGEVTLTPR